MVKLSTCKVIKKEKLADNVIVLSLEKPKDFEFIPGQFAQFRLPNPKKPGAFIPRSYSLSSLPTDGELKFYIKLVEGGKSYRFFKNIKKGNKIEIMAPLGHFNIVETDCSSYFIATGVGISPILGMIRDLLENHKTARAINLLFGLRNEGNIFWNNKFSELKNEHGNFNFSITLSRPEAGWMSLKGRVTEHLDKIIDKNGHYYICGSLGMITDVRKILEEKGIEKNKIHFEVF